MKWLPLLVFFSALYEIHAQQSVVTTTLDAYCRQLASDKEAMGSISIFRNGAAAYQCSIGWADQEQKVAADSTTAYRIGSVTKMFTATVVMLLVEEGKISLDDRLSRFFPKIPHGAEITLSGLLHHNSGLRDDDYLKWKYYGKSYRLKKRAEYANCNYVLLSEIVEQVENRYFGDVLDEKIFSPCGLSCTYYGHMDPKDACREAVSYRYISGWKATPPNDLDDSAGAGGVVSTPADLNRFLYALFEEKLVSANGLTAMEHTVFGYGMGMMALHFYEKTAYSHAGAIDGFQSRVMYFPKEKIGICYTSNAVKKPMDDIIVDLLRLYFGRN